MEKWTEQNIPDQSGKIVIVTGANSGLGLETSKALVEKNAKVIMTGRSHSKLEFAAASIRQDKPNAEVITEILDLADLKSIKDFVTKIKSKYESINILINNAGVMAIPKSKTKDGFEMQFGTNHLGHFALTAQLFPLLKNAPGSRVINVSSIAALKGEINFDDIMNDNNYGRTSVYRQSKLANQMFTYELHDRLQNAGINMSAIAAHPGVSDTNLFDNMKPNIFLKILGYILMPLVTQPASRGALPQLYAATSNEAVSGGYYGPHGKREMKGYPKDAFVPDAAKDKDSCKKLWEESEKLTGVKFDI